MATRRTTRDADPAPARSAKRDSASRLFHRGNEGMNRVDSELERQKAKREASAKSRNIPFRFYVPVGEVKEGVILDDKPDFFMYEHTMKNPETGKWNLNKPCISDWDNCPLCEAYGEPAYVLFLSVLDLTPFKDSKGVTHPFSRKLMAVKPTQQKKFIRRYKKDGTLRGSIFEFARDGEKDAVIGNDIEYLEAMDEAELAENYTRSWKDREGKTHTENCGEPFDYETMFEEPTVEELEALAGTGPTPGSRRQVEHDLGEKAPTRSRRSGGAAKEEPATTRRSRRAAPEEDDTWDKDDDDADVPWEEEKAKPATRATRRNPVSAEDEPDEAPVRGRRGRVVEEEEDDDEPEPERRPASRRAATVKKPEEPPRRTRIVRRGTD